MSAMSPARPTRPCCTPATTRRPERSRAGSSVAATNSSASTPPAPESPSSAPARMLVAWNQEELDALPGLQDKAKRNGYDRCQIIDAAEVYRQLPAYRAGALGALTVPDESIICTWTASLALATDARLRGTELLLDHRVDRVEAGTEHTVLHTTGGEVRARYVVNAAGLGVRHDRRPVRASAVHRHPPPRRAARVRQALPAAGQPHRARGPDQARARACSSAPRSTAT